MANIEGLWHTTAMAADYEALLDPLQRLLGAVVMHDTQSDHPAIGRRGGMIWVADNSIEIGAPLGDVSPVRGFVAKWGGGMHSLALRITDMAQTREHLAAHGVGVLADVNEDIVFTKPGDTAGLLLEWSAMHTDDDPRWGFPLNDQVVPPLLEVREYAFVTALVADPVAVAERLAELFGTEVVRRVPDAAPGAVGAVVSLLDCLLVLVRLPAGGVDRATWGQDVSRPRGRAQGLRVLDLDEAVQSLTAAGHTVGPGIEGLPGTVLLDPDAISLPTYLCADLLPEDPRREG